MIDVWCRGVRRESLPKISLLGFFLRIRRMDQAPVVPPLLAVGVLGSTEFHSPLSRRVCEAIGDELGKLDNIRLITVRVCVVEGRRGVWRRV